MWIVTYSLYYNKGPRHGEMCADLKTLVGAHPADIIKLHDCEDYRVVINFAIDCDD